MENLTGTLDCKRIVHRRTEMSLTRFMHSTLRIMGTENGGWHIAMNRREGEAVEIKTYPEMNETIKDLLRRSEEPMNLYIVARIEELEKQLAAAAEDIWKYSTGNTCRSCIEWKEGLCSRPGPKDCGGYSWWKWRGFGEDDLPRDPRSRFERIKACRTPTDIVLLLNGNERRFCPKAYVGAKPDECKEPCGRCIVQWMEEMAP